MGKKVKLTVRLPKDLLSSTDDLAKKRGISRSRIVTMGIQELAEGYQVAAIEQKKTADLNADIEHEVLPEWR